MINIIIFIILVNIIVIIKICGLILIYFFLFFSIEVNFIFEFFKDKVMIYLFWICNKLIKRLVRSKIFIILGEYD